MNMQRGFTLVELLVVVAVIGILASIGIPSYNNYVIRGKLVEGTSELSDGRVKMEQFFQDNRTYVGGTCPAETANFTYDCNTPAATTNTYTITATGKGNISGYSYTINQNNAKTSVTPSSIGATCWIMKDGQSC